MDIPRCTSADEISPKLLASEAGFKQTNLKTHYKRLFHRHSEGLAIIDYEGSHFEINAKLARMLELNIQSLRLTHNWREIEPVKRIFGNPVLRRLLLKRHRVSNFEVPFINQGGNQLRLLIHGSLLRQGPNGQATCGFSVANITQRGRREERAERSSRLLAAYCSCLECELAEKIKEIEKSQAGITEYMRNLQKAQIVAGVVMDRIHQQKRELQDRIRHNLNLTIYPLIEHLREIDLPDSGTHILDVLEFNIKHMTSQFGVKLSSRQSRLSSREVQVCQMIRAGKDSREIAASLGLTYDTIIVHRKNVRKKLGLNNRRQSLAEFLRNNL